MVATLEPSTGNSGPWPDHQGEQPSSRIERTAHRCSLHRFVKGLLPAVFDFSCSQESQNRLIDRYGPRLVECPDMSMCHHIGKPMAVGRLGGTGRGVHHDRDTCELIGVDQPHDQGLEINVHLHRHNLARMRSVSAMPELTERDPDHLSTVFSAWLAGQLGPDADPSIVGITAPGSNGFSNETILMTARWSEDGEVADHKLVVRVHPTKHTLFLEADFSLQYKVLSNLQGIAGVPVPNLRWYEEDPAVLGVPFFVMDHVEGRIPADNLPYTMEGWLLESTPEQQETLWWSGIEALAAIHTLDWRALGFEFLADPTHGEPGLEKNMAYYRRFLDWAAGDRPQPTAEAVWEWLVANKPAERGPVVLSWGDSRIGNIIWDDDYQAAAVIDWEMAALGQPELDLGWWLYFDRQFSEGLGIPRPVGFPSHEDTVARYEQLIGREVGDLLWYQIFAGWRFAVIMCRLCDLLQGSDLLPGDSDMGTNNLATQFMAQLLGLPSPAEAGSDTST